MHQVGEDYAPDEESANDLKRRCAGDLTEYKVLLDFRNQ